MEQVWDSGPIGRIAVTIACLFLGPIGWLVIAVMWGFHFLNKKD